MRIIGIDIQNFRKLFGCHIDISKETTLFVGANNSGKTSAMDALAKFLANRSFVFNDITIAKRIDINRIGTKWVEADCEQPADLLDWDTIVPKMDIWLDVAPNEMHYVASIIPTLKWRGGKLGVRLSEETGDGEWRDSKQYKSLILEHHMAASRFGFLELYLPLNEVPVFNTSLRDGSISELSFLSKVISPLVQAYKGNNDFEVLKIVKEYSPLMESKKWISLDDQTKALQQVESAVDKLMELWKDDAIPTCLDVLRSIQDTGLFKLDERVDNILSSPAADESIRITALRKALSVPFTTLEKYFAYVSDNTRFATHQGVKGLEFPRVMVIIDDAEAKGFLFSYEKLFGVKLKTETDIKNEREGKDNSITRTTRLFYVACTRAQKSLAIIAYTYDCEAVKATAMKNNWFEDDEIRLLE